MFTKDAMRALIVLLLAAVASARLAPLLGHRDSIKGRYIVKLKSGYNVESSIASLGNARVFYRYKTLFPGFAAQLSDSMVQRLRESDAVEYIEEDGIVRANSIASWGLDRVDQISLPLDDVYQPIGDGSGVDVYVIDTGINVGHQDFGSRSAYGYDALGGSGADCNGHGTHCSGTVAGTEYGVAKGANVIGVRVLNCLGSGSWSGVVGGCEWVADNANGPSVASMSLGGGASATVDDAVQYMIDAGITVAVAAGNDDDDACDYSPARSVPAISVGATDSSDARAYFSNYGTCVDIFAPGVSIASTWIGGNDATNTISGTSMACPHVAGAAAIMLGLDSTMSPSAVKGALLEKSISGAVSDPETGSPNLLLYIGEGSGGGYIPDPSDPVVPTCGGYFNATSGTFTSPGYPSDYDNSLSCDYVISAADGDVVSVTFADFNLESSSTCAFDSVSIYDGASSSASLLGQWCGSANPGLVVSSGSSMLVRFESDSSVTYSGFSASYVTGDAPELPEEPETGDCGHVFTEKQGVMTSPNYPSDYDNNEDCSFLVRGEVGEVVILTFSDFDVESQSTCNYDAVQVFDGTSLVATLCGSTIPAPITSTSNSIIVKFTSDGSVTRGGFSASYVIA